MELRLIMSKIDQFPFLVSKEFFPVLIQVDEGEVFAIDTRSRLGKAGIIDISCNETHIGMIIGIKKTANRLFFGPSAINKPYKFRNILPYSFIKLLEYYSVDGIEGINVWIPEDQEFREFLIDLGFEEIGDDLIYNITPETLQKLGKKLLSKEVRIRNREEQIKYLVEICNKGKTAEEIENISRRVLKKVKDEGVLDKVYWDNRKVGQINLMIHAAALLEDNLKKDEFFDEIIKTIISSFDLDVRLPLVHELINAFQGKRPFNVLYVQKMVEELQKILPEQIKKIDKEKYLEWINDNMPIWKIHCKQIEKLNEEKQISNKLTISDFGKNINRDFLDIITDFVNHYNNEVVFYGIKTKI